MARVGDVYQVPAGTYGSPNTTISSTAYNANVNDVAADLNYPRPIVAGGTAATNDTMARQNLKTERSMQVITDYNTTTWETGSFASDIGASNSPEAPAAATVKYLGTVQVSDANNIVIEARNLTSGTMYMRKKVAGTWGAWSADSGSGAFVLKAGDQMTGDLSIKKAGPSFNLMDTAGTGGNWISGFNSSSGDLARWTIRLGDGSAESGGATGSTGNDFLLTRWRNDGAGIDNPVRIKRSDGGMTLSGGLTVNSNIQASISPTTGNIYFGNTGTKYLSYDGTNYGLNGGPLFIPNGAVYCAGGFSYTPGGPYTTGDAGGNWTTRSDQTIYFQNLAGTVNKMYISPSSITAGVNFTVSGANLFVTAATGAIADFNVTNAGFLQAFRCNTALVGSIVVTTTNTSFNTSCDERLKEDLKTFDAGQIIDDTLVYDAAWRATGERSYCVLAQQVVSVYPTAVVYKKDEDWWGVDYSKYVPVLLQELKALRVRVAELEGRLGAGVQPA